MSEGLIYIASTNNTYQRKGAMANDGKLTLSSGCFTTYASNPNNIWKGDNVILTQLPLLAAQVCLVVFATRFFYYILRPLNQPRFVADILAGFLLSPTFLKKTKYYETVIPLKSVLSVETLSHLGLIYYVFLTGLEMNLDNVLQARKKATSIALAGTIIPMGLGAGFYALHKLFYQETKNLMTYANTAKSYLFWTLALSVTGFPVLAHILADLKLLYTGLGKAALTAAMINDTYNWIMFILLIPFAIDNGRAIYSVSSTFIFVFFCFFVVRPPLVKVITRKTEEDSWDNFHLMFVVMGVFACASVTDILGAHSVVGAFVFGLIIPQGRFTDMLIERSDDIATVFMTPLFFAGFGVRIDMQSLYQHQTWPMVVLLVFLLIIPKILSTLIATYFFHGIPARDGLALGLLMNTKGILSLIMLNIAWDKEILSIESFSLMVTGILVMNIIVSPIINAMYKPKKRFEQNKLRTIQMLRTEAELRILACVHNTRHATGMINILEASSATRLSPLHVFALYLVELTGRATGHFTAHFGQPNGQDGAQNLTRSQVELEGINTTFGTYAEENDSARVEIFTAVSPYATIHEDIFNLAEERRTALILLPFHKQSNIEGTLEITNAAYKDINQNVMQDAPCSVAILVDRGLGSLSKISFRILMLFIGGPDDREALALAWRMAWNPKIQLSMVRILLLDEAAEVDTSVHSEAQGLLSAIMDNEKQKELDEEYVSSFRLMAVNNEESITYSEMEVRKGDDIPAALTELDKHGYDLYIVGQGKGRNSVVLSNLLEWTDCPELGVIGDIVTSNSFGSRSSVLVVQQYGFGGMVFGTTTQNPKGQGHDGSEIFA